MPNTKQFETAMQFLYSYPNLDELNINESESKITRAVQLNNGIKQFIGNLRSLLNRDSDNYDDIDYRDEFDEIYNLCLDLRKKIIKDMHENLQV